MWDLCWRFFSSVLSFCKTNGYYDRKQNFCSFCVQNPASGLLQIGQKCEKWRWRHNFRHDAIVIFFCVVLFFLSSLLTGSSFMSISSLALELWQFSSIRDWPDIRKSELPPSEFCPISGDWGELWILNLKRMSLIQCYSILRISRVSSFCRFCQLGGGGKIPPDPSRLGLRKKLFLKQVKSRVSRSKYPRIMIYFADFNININAYLSWFYYCMQHSNCYWNIDHSITSLNTGAV